MKKLVLAFVAVAAISFASCGNKLAALEELADSLDSIANVLDSLVSDTIVVDSVVAE